MLIPYDLKKVIGDPIHGYIPLTELEYAIIQLPIMNRLHYLRQTQTAYLTFPGSVSTRFSHVLGALHIGYKIISHLFSSITKTEYAKLFPTINNPEFLIDAVRMACLFHDLGHGPFSHAGEDTMFKVIKNNYPTEFKEAKALFGISDLNENKLPTHEYFSYKIITDEQSSIRETIVRHRKNGKKLLEAISQLLIKDESAKIVKDNILGFRILRKIVSSHLDADRMDYLLRDSLMSGVQFGQIDNNRIINNMAIKKDGKGDYQIAFHERSIGNIEDMLDARFKMYHWFYNHHTVIMTNELMKRAIVLMIEMDKSVEELFHWSKFEDGFSTDDYLLTKLRECYKKNQKKFREVLGLLDRRYLPTAIFKATPEVARFIDKITSVDGIHEDDKAKLKKIISYFHDKNGAEQLKEKLEAEGGYYKHCKIYQTDFHSNPYSPLDPDTDKIFLYRHDEKNLCELWSESPYFKKINEAYEEITTLSVFFVIPGKFKREVESQKEKIIGILAASIAKS